MRFFTWVANKVIKIKWKMKCETGSAVRQAAVVKESKM